MTAPVRVDDHGDVRVLVIDRPERRNALADDVLAALGDALRACDADAVRCAVLTGAGGVFAAGADLDGVAATDGVGLFTGPRAGLWDAIFARRTPLVAAVAGWALGGGCELALSCDVIVAAASARFGLPETRLGLVPGAAGTHRLVRAIGRAKAMDVILAGRLLTGDEAERAGLASRVVPDDRLADEALDVARAIAARAPLAQRLAREAADRALDLPLEAALALDRRAFALARSTADADEGIAAFRERREPRFEGR